MKKVSTFFVNLLLTAVRHLGSIVISIILIIVGAIWSKVCLYIGLFLLASNVIVAVVGTIRLQRIMSYRSDDDPEFNEMMDRLTDDPDGLLSDMINGQEQNKNLHGTDLLALSDDDLFETVFFQNCDLVEQADDENEELELLSGARRIFYILAAYDAEVQNGGLCQFYVNSSSAVAPFVSDALKTVGATEHKLLFDEFNAKNNIDVSEFKLSGLRGYKKLAGRFDFDAFDDSFYELPALQDSIVAYVKQNIEQF